MKIKKNKNVKTSKKYNIANKKGKWLIILHISLVIIDIKKERKFVGNKFHKRAIRTTKCCSYI